MAIMEADRDIDYYLDVVISEHLYSNKKNLLFQMEWLFRGIDFLHKNVLEIGGGSGVVSFYISYKGADNVICLEPEAEGSSSDMQDTFQKLQQQLKTTNVLLEKLTFQSYKNEGEAFDVILLNNSINHLNETACINLLWDKNSRDIYKSIFLKISSISKQGTKIIICDCSRYNFFALLKVPNPFAASIEWRKHQAPEIWADLLSSAGFVNPNIRWSSINKLGTVGRIFTGNKLIAFFLRSHFCLSMVKG